MNYYLCKRRSKRLKGFSLKLDLSHSAGRLLVWSVWILCSTSELVWMSYIERRLYHLVMHVGLRVNFKETSYVFISKWVLSPASGTKAKVEADPKLAVQCFPQTSHWLKSGRKERGGPPWRKSCVPGRRPRRGARCTAAWVPRLASALRVCTLSASSCRCWRASGEQSRRSAPPSWRVSGGVDRPQSSTTTGRPSRNSYKNVQQRNFPRAWPADSVYFRYVCKHLF